MDDWHQRLENRPQDEKLYILGSMPLHLAEGGDKKRLYALIDRGWLDLKLAHGFSYRALLEDVELAIDTAKKEVNWSQLVRFSLVYDILMSKVTAIPLAVLGALSQIGQHQRALDYAALISDPRKQSEAYCLIAEGLIDNDSIPEADAVLLRAQTMAGAIGYEPYRDETWAKIAVVRVRAGQIEEALGIVMDKVTSDHSRQRMLVWMTTTLADAGELDNARAIANAIERDSERARALIEVAVQLARSGRIGDAVALAESLQPAPKAEALAEIALALARSGQGDPQPGQAESLDRGDALRQAADITDRALGAAEAMPLRLYGVDFLLQVADALARTGKSDWAYEAVQEIEPREKRFRAMGQIAGVVEHAEKSGPGYRSVPAQEVEELARAGEIKRAAEIIGFVGDRAEALARVGAAVAQSGRQEAAGDLLLQALTDARTMGQGRSYAVVGGGAPVLASVDNGETLWEVFRAVKEVTGWWSQPPGDL